MKKVRKKLFTLSGLFMVLAQVFVMAFSGIVAIAVTQDETTKNLFDVNGSSATMAYELVDNDTIKWTVNLKKGANDSPTRFMVDLKAGDSSVVPEQIQSTNPEMVFESNYGDEYIQGGFSEQVTGSMSGETSISFVTTRQISNLVVTPKLVTVPVSNEAVAMAATPTTDPTDEAEAEVQPTVASEPVNLLENVPTVTFDIPAVEAEEPEENQEENQEENTPVAPEVEGDVEDETTTPGTEVETEDGTETPTNTAGNGDVETQGVVTETGQNEVEGFIQEPIVPAQYQGFVSLTGAQLLANPLDPFQYHDNTDGIYPKHETKNYTNSNTSDNIRNYNYGNAKKADDAQEEPKNIELFDINGGDLNFQDGYHEHGSGTDGRINTKKTVAPVPNEENVFQIQLDTIGDAIKTNEQADIVLVLDKSTSMQGTRWSQLKTAVQTFTGDLLAENEGNNIQIGLVSFSSHEQNDGSKYWPKWNDYIDADVASFSEIPSGGTSVVARQGFSSNATTILGHTLLASNPDSGSGTPTFIGVDAGLNLLYDTDAGARNANTVKKIMITITDGEPTYRPNSSYGLTNSGTAKIRGDSGNYLRYSTRNFDGNGSTFSENNRTATIDFVAHKDNGKYNDYPKEASADQPGTSFYSIGYNTSANANLVVDALGREGAFLASDVPSLVTALKNAVVSLINTIANATITDPISDYVELVSNVTGTGLYLKDGAITTTDQSFNQAITLNTAGNQIIASDVTLGSDSSGRQGYRLTYKVKLKDEFHTGKFYPTNGTTYIANGDKGNHYYAVPSIRTAPTPVDVSFTKKNGSETSSEALAGAQFVLLQDNQIKYTSNTTDANGRVTFTDVLPGEYVLSESATPNGHITMEDMEVIVTRDGSITKKDGGAVLETVANTLKPIALSLNKLGSDDNALKGATFELQQDKQTIKAFAENKTTAGLHELTDVVPGTYDLVETNAPEGYEVLGKIGELTIDKYGTATFTKTGESSQDVERDAEGATIQLSLPTVKNNLKPIALSLNKLGADGKVLGGAIFELQKSGEKKATLTETTDGLHELVGVTPETYELVETNAPDGYKVLGKIGDLKIDSAGNASFKKVGETEYTDLDPTVNDRINITLPTVTNELKPFELEVKKRNADNHNQFLQGAVFTLYDKTPTDDTATELAKVTTDSNGKGTFKKTDGSIYQLEAGQEYFFKETTAPDGYVLSTSIYKVVIAIDGNVAITKDGNTVTEVTDDLIPDNGNNQIGLTIDNKPKTPLPSTGGSGTMFFVTVGVLGLLSTGLYFLQRKDQEVA